MEWLNVQYVLASPGGSFNGRPSFTDTSSGFYSILPSSGIILRIRSSTED